MRGKPRKGEELCIELDDETLVLREDEIQSACEEANDMLRVFKEFDEGMVALTGEDYRRMPAAFFDLYRTFRRIRRADNPGKR